MPSFYYKHIYPVLKRGMDIATGLFGILIFGIPMLLVALAIRLDSKGPAIFKQKRVGRGGQEFWMYKFRSMVENAEEILKGWEKNNPELLAKYKANSFKLKDDPRITKVGKFIRRTSLDELPQFINVLKGDMSLVGPRAYKKDELQDYGKKSANLKEKIDTLLTVNPGITGLWQVSGRSEVDFLDRIKMDAEYAARKSVLEDIKIIFKTPVAVLKKDGAY